MTNPADALSEQLLGAVQGPPEEGVISVYLFGSQAEGRAHRESDVDLAVLLDRGAFPEARERFEAALHLFARFRAAVGSLAVDLVVLNDAPPGLGRAIVTHGRRLFCSDTEADRAFVRDVQLKAADLEPFLRRTRRLKLDALAR